MGTKEERRDSIPFSEAAGKKTTEQKSELKKSIPFGSVKKPEPTSGTTTTTTTPKKK